MVNIGYGNMVSLSKLVSITSAESAPMKRIISEAKDRGKLIDATYGRKTRAVLIMDSDHVILASMQPDTIATRYELEMKDYELNAEEKDD
ncbi:MAG: DUF370 domain-containing protein [Oscillospiraceae bacterium]|jgi:regulator of extracellular matrix RemA (YlzA/DUF370 family)|nr:DUF370 domain-containing protein [Oscillospiraceae bacterium]